MSFLVHDQFLQSMQLNFKDWDIEVELSISLAQSHSESPHVFTLSHNDI